MQAQRLHIKLSDLVKSERKITHEILLCIQQMDQTKAYAELGYPSLFEYLVKEQKYSEGAAQRRISSARLLKELPEIEKKVQEGHLNLTQLSKLASATNQDQKATGHKVSTEQKREILEQMENKTGFETEQLLNQNFECNLKPKKEVTPRKQTYDLHLRLTPEQYEKLKKAQALLSHVVHDGSFANVLEVLCDKLIQKKEGKSLVKDSTRVERNSEINSTAGAAVQSEESHQAKQKGNHQIKKEAFFPTRVQPERTLKVDSIEASITAAAAVKSSGRRTAIPVSLQRLIYQRAQNCCEYVGATGHRCRSRYQTQLDHILPLARGGGNEPANLRVLCRTHNLSEARRWGVLWS